jgi:hypothetical protein
VSVERSHHPGDRPRTRDSKAVTSPALTGSEERKFRVFFTRMAARVCSSHSARERPEFHKEAGRDAGEELTAIVSGETPEYGGLIFEGQLLEAAVVEDERKVGGHGVLWLGGILLNVQKSEGGGRVRFEDGELRDLVTISGASFRAPTIRSTAIMQRTMCHRKAIPLRAEGSQKKRWEVGRREGTHRICSMHIVSSPDPLTIDTSAS